MINSCSFRSPSFISPSLDILPHSEITLKDHPPIDALGNTSLLKLPAMAVAGARNCSPQGLMCSSFIGSFLASQKYVTVSGYARGSDMEAHCSALVSQGPTIAVLPYGINHSNINKLFKSYSILKEKFDPSNLLVISQFPADAPWSVRYAMERNNLIIALSSALFVTEAALKGGTMACAKVALSSGLPVYVSNHPEAPPGNSYLIDELNTPTIDSYIRDYYDNRYS